jgi:hypothetical protein
MKCVSPGKTCLQAAVEAAPDVIHPPSVNASAQFCSMVSTSIQAAACGADATASGAQNKPILGRAPLTVVIFVATFLAITAACTCCAYVSAHNAVEARRRRPVPPDSAGDGDLTLVRCR